MFKRLGNVTQACRALGYSRDSFYRPRRPAPSRHSKNFPATQAGIARVQGIGLDAVEIWFADEARIGQKNGITRRRARRGTGPVAPQDQRCASTCIFGAACPHEGKGAALVLPLCDTAAMNLHLAGISELVSPDRHAVLLLDQAGRHLSGDVVVPGNITLPPLPPKCRPVSSMDMAAMIGIDPRGRRAAAHLRFHFIARLPGL